MNFTVDLTQAIPPELLALPRALRAILPDVAEECRNEVIRQAHAKLGSTAEDYIAGLQTVKYEYVGGELPAGDFTLASVTLEGWLPNAIEFGWAGGDMKVWLLAGPNAKETKKGVRYNTVPFRHGAPGGTERHFPTMGSAYEFHIVGTGNEALRGIMDTARAVKLGQRVYAEASKLTATTSHSKTGTKWGDRLEEGLAPLLRSHHKTDIYAGMVRETKVYRKKEQPQYKTFRRVSDNSDPAAWIHPGIEARHLFQDGAEYMQKAAAHIFQSALRGPE